MLVTGSTGYVGGRLVPKLLDLGCRVRALGRSIAKLQARPWARHPLVELARGDVLDYESLLAAAKGCRAAFYAELLENIDEYRQGYIPLIVPVTLLNHYVRKYDQAYLKSQYYLDPHPLELKLRNHV